MHATRIELTNEDAASCLRELLAQLQTRDGESTADGQSLVVDCKELTSLDYPTLQNLLRLRGLCVLTGTHKLEACMQRYGISHFTDSLPSHPHPHPPSQS